MPLVEGKDDPTKHSDAKRAIEEYHNYVETDPESTWADATIRTVKLDDQTEDGGDSLSSFSRYSC